MLPQVFKATK